MLYGCKNYEEGFFKGCCAKFTRSCFFYSFKKLVGVFMVLIVNLQKNLELFTMWKIWELFPIKELMNYMV